MAAGNTQAPRGDGRSRRRWQGCIYLPYSQYTKSRGRLATRQIVVAGKARSSTAVAGAVGEGKIRKKLKEKETQKDGDR